MNITDTTSFLWGLVTGLGTGAVCLLIVLLWLLVIIRKKATPDA